MEMNRFVFYVPVNWICHLIVDVVRAFCPFFFSLINRCHGGQAKKVKNIILSMPS
jgi:hypothetical protein